MVGASGGDSGRSLRQSGLMEGEAIMAGTFHVIKDAGYHPHNMWEHLDGSFYALTGSVYAFNPEDVIKCKAAPGEPCRCWVNKDTGAHECPREGCEG